MPLVTQLYPDNTSMYTYIIITQRIKQSHKKYTGSKDVGKLTQSKAILRPLHN